MPATVHSLPAWVTHTCLPTWTHLQPATTHAHTAWYTHTYTVHTFHGSSATHAPPHSTACHPPHTYAHLFPGHYYPPPASQDHLSTLHLLQGQAFATCPHMLHYRTCTGTACLVGFLPHMIQHDTPTDPGLAGLFITATDCPFHACPLCRTRGRTTTGPRTTCHSTVAGYGIARTAHPAHLHPPRLPPPYGHTGPMQPFDEGQP